MRKRVNHPQELLPLMPAEFQILLALADGDRHGYGIMTEVRERSGGKVVLGPGILYGTLKRLAARGLVADAVPPSQASPGDARRRYYQLTALGRTLAGAEARRLAGLVVDARAKDLIPESPPR